MITVEICSKTLDNSYDFVIDEYAEIETVIDDVAQMMSQRDRREIAQDASKLCLYSLKIGKVLCQQNSLYDYGIKSGDKLYLV